MAHAELGTPSQLAASHVPAADSSSLWQGSERRTRSQRWRMSFSLDDRGEIGLSCQESEPQQWAPLSTVNQTLTADVPDLAWLLGLNGLAQSASPAGNTTLQAALSQVNMQYRQLWPTQVPQDLLHPGQATNRTPSPDRMHLCPAKP